VSPPDPIKRDILRKPDQPRFRRIDRHRLEPNPTDSSRPHRRRRSRRNPRRERHARPSHSRRATWLGPVLALLAVLALVVGGWWLLRTPAAEPSAANGSNPAGAANAEFDHRRASERLERALDAETVDQLDPLVRWGSLPPATALARLERLPDAPEPRWFGRSPARAVEVEVFILAPAGEPSRLALFTPLGGEGWRLDVDAFFHHCEPPIEDFAAGSADECLARVNAFEDDYFNGIYGDDQRWQCFALAHPELERPLFGYCLRDSAVASELQRARNRYTNYRGALPEPQPMRLILRLSADPAADARQVEIAGFLADEWVLPDESSP